jgi:hypothetical protein
MAGNPASTLYVQQNAGGSSPSGPTYTIGQVAQGGVIFWLTPDGQHGLAISMTELTEGTGIQWGPTTSGPLGATANDLSFGLNYTTCGEINTQVIVSYYDAASVNRNLYAAGLCADYSYTMGGVVYGGWYLPSLAEVGLIMANQGIINSAATDELGTETYWSSFVNDSSVAWSQGFSTASQDFTVKLNALRVRAVRAF